MSNAGQRCQEVFHRSTVRGEGVQQGAVEPLRQMRDQCRIVLLHQVGQHRDRLGSRLLHLVSPATHCFQDPNGHEVLPA